MTSSPFRAVFALPAHVPVGATLGALLAALVDIVASSVSTTFLSPGAQLLHAVWDLASFVALGAATDLLAYASLRLAARRSLLGLTLFAAISGWCVWWLLSDWLVHRAHHTLAGRHVELLLAAMTCGMGLAPTVCLIVAHQLSRWRATCVLATLVALAALVGNLCVLRDDYAPLHVYGTTLAFMLFGCALAPRVKLAAAWRRKLALSVMLLTALACVPPPNHVRVALTRSPGAVAAWLLATTYWRLPHAEGTADPELARWLTTRAQHAPRVPTTPQLLTSAPVVVLLTIDAVRADLLADPVRAQQLPTLSRLAREGVSFTQARSPGSQTAVTLTATFAGKHASELAWAPHGAGDYRHLYAAADATPRWPRWLTARGIDTYKVVSLAFLANEFGVAPGFVEQQIVTRGKAHALGASVIAPLLAHLEAAAAKPQPCFVYAHLTEPHEPYDRGAVKTGPAFERYFSEVVRADALLGRVVERLASPGLAGRALLVVTSDHGEAFGEHGTHEHSKTLYDELLRVPLVFWGKSVVPRTLAQAVSLIDLGPTLLDVFGIQTPDDLAGESLLPLLTGRDTTLTRPIIAEGRLRRALILGSRKLIVDERVHTIEAYDLARDAGELHNLYDTQPERFADMLVALQAYFDARGYRASGYVRKFRQ
ncbi:MAG TPA: sulfatase-like hydrolase/transferase [Polyangiales bacterium]|nr:sulfatase-like hydrolase/transferase [Polyangiales bacterium]